jgi:hypothetical protein
MKYKIYELTEINLKYLLEHLLVELHEVNEWSLNYHIHYTDIIRLVLGHF